MSKISMCVEQTHNPNYYHRDPRGQPEFIFTITKLVNTVDYWIGEALTPEQVTSAIARKIQVTITNPK